MEGMSIVFKDDVHYTNTVSCAGCHGGDANEDDQNLSMSAARGFKVRVTRQGTPEYCGNCHGDAQFMGKFSPGGRVDQLALYRTSVHGRQLAQGRKNAAECVDCHGVHNIRAASDPLSPTQPQHVADTCAKCHGATADLFRQSRHGQIFTSARRPGCTVCHASHATQPATAAMLAGPTAVCARCHRPESRAGKVADEIGQILASLEAKGPAASEALNRARRAVHTLDVNAVRQAAEGTLPGAAEKTETKTP
jgi:predicted CXXCH cytochrome family protein